MEDDDGEDDEEDEDEDSDSDCMIRSKDLIVSQFYFLLFYKLFFKY